MNQGNPIVITPADIEKQCDHVFDGYPFASLNGFAIGKDHGKIVEVIEVQGEQFRRNLPPIPTHSKNNTIYSISDNANFLCCDYPDKVVFNGCLEEERILELRLCTFRKLANELKDIVKTMKEVIQQIDRLTNEGDLASCFQHHEQLNMLNSKALPLTKNLVSLQDGNSTLINSLEFKMKAAGEIEEYQQAQQIKTTMESYSKLRDEILKSTTATPQTIVQYGNILESALQLCNYLTD